MTDEAGFLAAIAAEPTDDLRRLAYADWLDEHGEPAKAEFLRLEHLLRTSAARYAALVDQLDADWLIRTGICVRLILTGYAAARKIEVIRLIRAYTGLGLAEAKGLSESLPAPLPGPPLAPDGMTEWRRRFTEAGAVVAFSPAAPAR